MSQAQKHEGADRSAAVRRPGLVTIPLTEPFWKAANDGAFLLQECGSCGHRQHYPRNLCGRCWSEDLSWTRASGEGTVWTFTVVEMPGHPAWAAETPYVIAVVELDEGPRAMTRVIDCAAEDMRVGMRVVLRPTWDEQLEQLLLTFAPDRRDEDG
jgi:uncharacterized OB-fold protein